MHYNWGKPWFGRTHRVQATAGTGPSETAGLAGVRVCWKENRSQEVCRRLRAASKSPGLMWVGSVTHRVRFMCRGNGDTGVRLVPKQAKQTTWPAVYQSRKRIKTHLDPSDSVSKDLREGELKKKKEEVNDKISYSTNWEQTDPHIIFFF